MTKIDQDQQMICSNDQKPGLPSTSTSSRPAQSLLRWSIQRVKEGLDG